MMKRKRKRWMLLVLLAVLIFMAMPVQAAAKDVTKASKTKVQRLLRQFDGYLGYGCKKSTSFKFDDYARTTMLCMSQYPGNCTLKQLRKTHGAAWKKCFTARVNFKMKKLKGELYGNSSPDPWSSPANLFQLYGGRTYYLGGDWGEVYPKGYAKKIVRNSKKKYTVTYEIKWFDVEAGKTAGKMGVYKVILSPSKNKYGFEIRDIKRVSAKVSYL